MRILSFDVVDMRIDILEGLLGFFRVKTRSIIFQPSCVVDVVYVENSVDILLDNVKYFRKSTLVRLRFLLNFLDDPLLQDKTCVEQSFIVRHQLPLDTSPHVVDILIKIVNIKNIPIFHERCVFGQQHVLHVFEVIFCHLVVHLVLIVLQISQEFTFPVQIL